MTRLLLILLAAALATPALAQTEDAPKKVQFIDMNALGLQGEGVKVPVAYLSVEKRAKFGRILRLKHPVLQKIKATARQVDFR